MRISMFFVLVCLLLALFLFVNHAFLDTDYIVGTQNVYDENGDVSFSYPLLSLPIGQYLDDNERDIASFERSAQRSFDKLSDFSDKLTSLSQSFFNMIYKVDSFIESVDDLSSAYLYQNNDSYYTFARSYYKTLKSCYDSSFSWFEKYIIPRYSPFIDYLERDLMSDAFYTKTDRIPLGELGFSNITGVGNLINPDFYFLKLKVNPRYHLSIQDQLLRFGIPHLEISTYSETNVFNIYRVYCYRFIDAEGTLSYDVFDSSLTDYVYDSSTNTVYKR